jgi:hypothetical protein
VDVDMGADVKDEGGSVANENMRCSSLTEKRLRVLVVEVGDCGRSSWKKSSEDTGPREALSGRWSSCDETSRFKSLLDLDSGEGERRKSAEDTG